MKLRAIQAAELSVHIDAWRALEPELAFAEPEWVVPFVQVFGAKLDVVVVLAEHRGELVGVLPMMHASRWSLPTGSVPCFVAAQNDDVPELGLAMRRGREERVVTALLRWSGRNARRSNATHFARVRRSSRAFAALDARSRHPMAMAYVRCDHETHHTDVQSDLAALGKLRSKNFRKQLRRAERMAKQHELEVSVHKTPTEIEAVLDDVARISEGSWQGKAGSGAFAQLDNRMFYSAMSLGFAARNRTRLFVCRKANEAIGFILHVGDATGWHALKSETIEGNDACMVGWQINGCAHHLAREEDVPTITHGTLVTDFKRRWTTRTTAVHHFTFFRKRVLGATHFAASLSGEIVKRAQGKTTLGRCPPWTDFYDEANLRR